MTKHRPRFTEFFGYSAKTSAPNEQPKWGHLTAEVADDVQERFEEWLAAHDREVQAQAWDEGFGAGFHNMADIADHFRAGGGIETIRPPAVNPYRVEGGTR